jgi:hypothetical protein
VPTNEVLWAGHMNCAGFINVLCLHEKKLIPGIHSKSFYAGGTAMWHSFLDDRSEPFDLSKDYPNGTLLLRNYRSENDQGHLAVLVSSKTIAHSWPEKGVLLEDLSTFLETNGHAYFEVCVPAFFAMDT